MEYLIWSIVNSVRQACLASQLHRHNLLRFNSINLPESTCPVKLKRFFSSFDPTAVYELKKYQGMQAKAQDCSEWAFYQKIKNWCLPKSAALDFRASSSWSLLLTTSFASTPNKLQPYLTQFARGFFLSFSFVLNRYHIQVEVKWTNFASG